MRWGLLALAVWAVGCGKKEAAQHTQTARERYCTSLETAAAATDQQLRVSEAPLRILVAVNGDLARKADGGDGDALSLRTAAGACAAIASTWGRAAGYADAIRARNDALESAFVDPPGALRLPEELLYDACAPRLGASTAPPPAKLAEAAKENALAAIEKLNAARAQWKHDCEDALTRCEVIGWRRAPADGPAPEGGRR